MVIGYNPSHSNINSEVNAPFKILSTLLRFIDNEQAGLGAIGKPSQGLQNYQIPRGEIGAGERLDTMEGYNELYDDEDDDDLNMDAMDDDSDNQGLDLDDNQDESD